MIPEGPHCVKSVKIQKFFWSIFSHVWTEYWDFLRISLYSVQYGNTWTRKNSIFGHFLRSAKVGTLPVLVSNQISVWRGWNVSPIFDPILVPQWGTCALIPVQQRMQYNFSFLCHFQFMTQHILRLHHHHYFHRDSISRWLPTTAKVHCTCPWDKTNPQLLPPQNF